jgi:hypothetical protein
MIREMGLPCRHGAGGHFDFSSGGGSGSGSGNLVGVVAHNELGIPSDTIRNDALTSAGFISIVLVWGSILRR